MSDSKRNVQKGAEPRPQVAPVVVFLSIVVFLGVLLVTQSGPGESLSVPTATQTVRVQRPAATVTATTTEETAPPVKTLVPTLTYYPPHVPRIGIVAGHWWLDETGQQSLDVGGVCDEGTPNQLTELEVNYEVAQRVFFELHQAGYQVDFLQEWDERLNGYEADLLISIHADACLYPEASGFKVARVADSLVPEVEDRLVACMVEKYGARTGLVFHEGSITMDMRRYHTFYEIDPDTPGAIIETGFMLADRQLLTQRPDLVAQGIIDGILCFLEGEGKTLE